MDMAKVSLGRIMTAALTVALLSATACTTQTRGAEPPVIAPGRPGDGNRTLSPEEAARRRPDNTPNAADRTYVGHMIEHHRQALAMSALAPDRATSPAVKHLAERITAAQTPEIAAMQSWQRKTQSTPAHDHTPMPGMATEAQLKALADARGTDFDHLFLTLMTAHHEGALKMAADVLKNGNDPAVEEWANEVVATQSAEISRMRTMS
ncbi:DUF305 domain-containing protein [Streptomyces sp. NPDC046866]|uniref:DUF305 domain-containing protein n=1 Tax=Streptomyces sp. NPDC046866 TaxID=3154921 RepID=UPI003453057F